MKDNHTGVSQTGGLDGDAPPEHPIVKVSGGPETPPKDGAANLPRPLFLFIFFTILLLSITSFVIPNEHLNAPKASAFLSDERCDRPLAGGVPFVMEKEIWKDIKGYKGYYQISNRGRVKSLGRIVIGINGVSLNVNGRILQPVILKTGYRSVAFWKNRTHKTQSISRLVAIAFLKRTKGRDQVNHKDHDRTNDRVENLEWTTRRENNTHQFLRSNKSSKHTGVYRLKETHSWQAQIGINRKVIRLGLYATEEDASKAYKKALRGLKEHNKYCV